jgi:dolichol-phosphate mannosyltransferase
MKMMGKIPKYDYEIIFVDNNSRDNSRSILKSLAHKDPKVTVIFMSRNFTSEYSSLAAMRHSLGDMVTVVDCDLQDPPDVIIEMIKKWEKGAKVVIGVRNKIDDSFFMRIVRKWFYKLFKIFSSIEMPLDAGSFCLLDRKVMDVINALPEKVRFFRGLRAWAGFKTEEVIYERKARKFGRTKNTLIDYLSDAQRAFLGFSYIPLNIITTVSFMLVILSFIFILGYLYVVIVFGNPIRAQIPLTLTVVFFGSIQLLAIGVLGKYIQVIVEEVKGRPPYVIEEIINDHRNRKNNI